MAYTLIEATTSAVATKAGFAVRKVPATLYATGLATTEKCDIFISPDDGDSWETVISTDSGGATDERREPGYRRYHGNLGMVQGAAACTYLLREVLA